ncbi:MAG: AAA family ATPase [Candidatus Thiosymbion ectosymbiont of Robbea hypermnestra]|nr:AAA family ATPase [Candidatus Thiosymbion ectosymbiont of Robbea hypermnestra]
MKFTFKKIGYIDDGEVTLGDLTVICGRNNVGKTYLSYTIYGFLKHLWRLAGIRLDKETLEQLYEQGVCRIDLRQYTQDAAKILARAGNNFSRDLPRFFNTTDEYFVDAAVGLEIENCTFFVDVDYEFKGGVKFSGKELIRFTKEKGASVLDIVLQSDSSSTIPREILQDILSEHIADALFSTVVPNPFVITSERTGISLFYKELDYSKSALLDHLADAEKPDPITLLNTLRSRYAEPIKDNIDVIRDYDSLCKRKSHFQDDDQQDTGVVDALLKLTEGSFRSLNDQLIYAPRKEPGRDEVSLPIYMASSSIKSLFLMDFYIRRLAQDGDILIIDEPELNLHPDNQWNMARLLARMVNRGVRVLITTHSDFLVREINSLIMLSGSISDKGAIMERGKISESDILRPEQVRAYTVSNQHRIEALNVDEHGMALELFDELVNEVDALSDDIYYGMED